MAKNKINRNDGYQTQLSLSILAPYEKIDFLENPMTLPTRSLIGALIKSVRQAKSLTQADVAEALGCEIETISRYERGKSIPDSEQLLRLAIFLGVSPLELLPYKADRSRESLLRLRANLCDLILTIDDHALLISLIDQASARAKK